LSELLVPTHQEAELQTNCFTVSMSES